MAAISQLQSEQRDPDRLARIGGWLFRRRSALPIPLALPLLLAPASSGSLTLAALVGSALVAAGEGLRLWGVHHIGAVSRTRSERLGPLIDTGPFGVIRNPLYVGNVVLWLGFAVISNVRWMIPIVLIALALEYHAIVRWEETLLDARLGAPYREYAARVPRWIPRSLSAEHSVDIAPYSWRETVFSERGTLIAIAVGCVLLWLKARF